FLGYNEDEIVKYFPEDLKDTAEKFGISIEKLLDRMRYYYNGFCFDGIHKLYNPFSTINFLKTKNFDNFWMESGTTKLIYDYLKNHKLSVEQFHNIRVSRDFARSPGDMDSTPPEGFLYQGGYLTVSRAEGEFFALDYPNTEVLNSMSRLVSEIVCKNNDNEFTGCRSALFFSLETKNKETLMSTFNHLLASIPYDDFRKGAENNIMDNRYTFSLHEWHYRSMILAFVRGCGVAAVAEMHTNLGRADLVLDFLGNVWVIEVKVAYKPEDVPAKLAEAKAQIIDGNYTAPYPNATAIAMVIDDTKREITESEFV
ncbi:MAG: ATP-binding protein, partial [Dysgonamonadaceae bacterium]|nr:ATP-binding protein [Dysgonamonadaceae bacterium]